MKTSGLSADLSAEALALGWKRWMREGGMGRMRADGR